MNSGFSLHSPEAPQPAQSGFRSLHSGVQSSESSEFSGLVTEFLEVMGWTL